MKDKHRISKNVFIIQNICLFVGTFILLLIAWADHHSLGLIQFILTFLIPTFLCDLLMYLRLSSDKKIFSWLAAATALFHVVPIMILLVIPFRIQESGSTHTYVGKYQFVLIVFYVVFLIIAAIFSMVFATEKRK